MWGNYVVRNIVLAVSLLVIVLFAANLLLNLFTRHNKHVEVPDFMNMTLDEALAASREDKLRIEVNDSLYVPAFDPGVILEQRPAAGTEVKPGRRIYVTVNSSQQRMIDVPYVAGYSLRQAKNILETVRLEIEKLVYVDDIATNNVLEQRVGPEVVAADNRVQARVGSGVVLTVGRAPGADLVSVPRVVGLPLREAKSRIWEAGLNVAGVTLAEDIDRMNLRQARVYLHATRPGAPRGARDGDFHRPVARLAYRSVRRFAFGPVWKQGGCPGTGPAGQSGGRRVFGRRTAGGDGLDNPDRERRSDAGREET